MLDNYNTNLGPLKVNSIFFLLAFGIGMFFVYIYHPEPTIIIKHPTPENAGKIIYQDDAESCYKYKAIEVECPSDPDLISNQPLVIN